MYCVAGLRNVSALFTRSKLHQMTATVEVAGVTKDSEHGSLLSPSGRF